MSIGGDIGNVHNGGVSKKKLEDLIEDLKLFKKRKECSPCWEREERGALPTRNIDRYWKSSEEVLNYLEFTFSNLCNLKCRMCNSAFSTTWQADERKLQENLEFRNKFPLGMRKIFEQKQDIHKYLDSIDISKIDSLTFRGGEPLIQKEVFYVLEYFVNQGVSRQVKVNFSTSGTLVKGDLSLLKNFKKFRITISVEATGELYRYVRGGRKNRLEDVENFIKSLSDYKNVEVFSNSCVSAYSAFGIADLLGWVRENTNNPDTHNIGHIYPVISPNYISMRALPLEMREKALEKNISDLKDLGISSSFMNKTVESLLCLKDSYDEELNEKFKKYTRFLDHQRDECILEVVPEFSEIF